MWVRKYAQCLLLGLWTLGLSPSSAADTWGGSIALTSDYFVRGISRSNDQPALQADIHLAGSSGFFGGLFASSVQIDSEDSRNGEISAFFGFTWSAGNDWRNKIVIDHYSYPWNAAGSRYNYDELSLDAAYQDWLELSVVYSPNTPRYVQYPGYQEYPGNVEYSGLISVAAKSIEMNLQSPRSHRLAATAGVGYSYLDGPDAAGYVYWSLGANYDLAPVSVSLAYVDTTAPAKALFYNEAAHGRWTATLILHF
jgi:uncharacterized protein (TIGR02001 family)